MLKKSPLTLSGRGDYVFPNTLTTPTSPRPRPPRIYCLAWLCGSQPLNCEPTQDRDCVQGRDCPVLLGFWIPGTRLSSEEAFTCILGMIRYF